MRTVKAIDLARDLGIPRSTMARWCSKRSDLAFKRNGQWYVRVDALADCDGVGGLIGAQLVARDRHRWIPLREIAARLPINPRTLRRWARKGSGAFKRIGRNWNVDPAELAEIAGVDLTGLI